MNAIIWIAPLWPLILSRRKEADCPIWRRRSLLILITLLSLNYLYWRCSASLNLSNPVATSLSILLLGAESWLLVSGLVPILLSWRFYSDGKAAAYRTEKEWEQTSWRPWVDILIPTYGEPLPVLDRCLLGCCSLNYPYRKIWVLDDSGRLEVEELAHKYGCYYKHRAERRNAKAGNLNAGLQHANGELVAVFDADFIPQQHFLNRCIGLLLNPKIAMVQTPQSFLNADPIMRNLGLEDWLLPDEESFYRWIEPVRNSWDAVVCAGTSFVVRRSALDQVGGFIETAISEDFVTGIAIAAKGWQLYYLAEKLSAGLAAETMQDFLRQRQRWAAGTIQALRLPEGPLRVSGLNWQQRLVFLEGALHWFNTVPRLVLLLMPLSIGFFGVVPVHFTTDALLNKLLPLWLCLLLSVGWLNRGSRHALLAELPGWALAIPLASTVLMGICGKVIPFRITPKHRINQKGGIATQLAIPLFSLLLLNGINLWSIIMDIKMQQIDPGLSLGWLWASLNLLGIFVAIRASWDKPCSDPTPWLKLELNGWLINKAGAEFRVKVIEISEIGAVLKYNSVPPNEFYCKLLLDTSSLGGIQLPALKIKESSTLHNLGVKWEDNQIEELKALKLWLFGRVGAWPERQAPPEWQAFFALLGRLLLLPKQISGSRYRCDS
jgi:cellulose synthase (UDP-forming)